MNHNIENEDEKDDLILKFLDGTHYDYQNFEGILTPREEQGQPPQVQEDNLSNESEKCNSQKLSDLGSDDDFLKKN